MAKSRNIPVSHLCFLVAKEVDGTPIGDEELLAKASNPSPADLDEFCAVIDKRLGKGTIARLDALWNTETPAAVHVWRYPTAAEKDANELRDILAKNLKTRIRIGTTTTFEGKLSRKNPSRIQELRLTADELTVTVRIAHFGQTSFENEAYEKLTDRTVRVRLGITENSSFVEVYAGVTDARLAVLCVLNRCFGQFFAKIGEAHKSNTIRPLSFTETDAKAVQANLNLAHVFLHGADARGIQGELTMTSKREKGRLLPLDSDDGIYTNQDKGVNKARGYALELRHQDGYVEQAVVRFLLGNKSHPHISFQNRCSRTAMARVRNQLYSVIRKV